VGGWVFGWLVGGAVGLTGCQRFARLTWNN